MYHDEFSHEEIDNLDNHMDILEYMLKYYSQRIDPEFFYNGFAPTIPELSFSAPNVIPRLINELTAYYTLNRQNLDMATCGAWSFFAGVGAVKLWESDWQDLQRRGIYEALIEPKGINRLDEYILELLEIPYIPDGYVPFTSNIYSIASELEELLLDGYGERDDDDFYKRVMDIHLAFYNFGIVYEMYQIGLR